MRVRKQSADGDYMFGNGQADFLKDTPEAVGQVVMTRLMLWLGEWFLDNEEGTPYLQGVIGKHAELTRNTVLRERILNSEGCVGITSYSSIVDPNDRKLTLSTAIDTIYGETFIEVGI